MIRDAAPADVPELAALFDAYRRFYERAGDLVAAARYVAERLNGPTRFFVAVVDGAIIGFVHLLPTFDTLGMRPAWTLEDLYVDPAARRTGVGAALLQFAEGFARESGASRLTLSTAHTNTSAQRLYERNGWVLDEDFRCYHRRLD
jgi:GNAT superfamily N-acetyltransferase